MYKIWEYFPEDARQFAASLTYEDKLVGPEDKPVTFLRAKIEDPTVADYDFCPLGAAFYRLRPDVVRADPNLWSLPTDNRVVAIMDILGVGDIDDVDFCHELRVFYLDFDDHKVDNLADALGVTTKEAS
jgi:hypothetical protein